jgi:hypothetical protein
MTVISGDPLVPYQLAASGFAPPTPSSRGPRAPRRSIKGLLPPDGAGCSTAVDCIFWLVLMELPVRFGVAAAVGTASNDKLPAGAEWQ